MARTAVKRQKPSATRKRRHTFSLSPDVTAKLEQVRSRRKMRSLSAALEAVVREQHAAELARQTSRQITDYYDNLSEEEQAEQVAWARFSESQLAKIPE